MIQHPEDDPLEGLEEEDDEQIALEALSRLEEVLQIIPWFGALGQPLGRELEALAQTYLDQLGFPDATPVPVLDWTEAADAAETGDYNSEAWEVEEQLRADLSREALNYSDEGALTDALERVTKIAGGLAIEAASTAASLWAVEDPQIIEIAAGHAAQAAYQAGLVLAAQAVEDHPFALRFRLFEQGRWPVALTGRTLQIF